MGVHIRELKVRPRKRQMDGMCGVQLAAMLGCWAASKDIQSMGTCRAAAENLLHCMRVTPPRRQTHRPAINFHLARLGKRM
ncbi:hypothetical protein F5146DRAFT_922137 [Armillaria mellea]|nr:hypothetical protein F5146DRAFT_922137 [Armillaria mellea]